MTDFGLLMVAAAVRFVEMILVVVTVVEIGFEVEIELVPEVGIGTDSLFAVLAVEPVVEQLPAVVAQQPARLLEAPE
mgnify:FL=1